MSVSAIALLSSVYAWSRKLVEFKGPSARAAGEPERSAAERSTNVAIVFIELRTVLDECALTPARSLGRLSLQPRESRGRRVARCRIIQPLRRSETSIAAVERCMSDGCGRRSGIQGGGQAGKRNR